MNYVVLGASAAGISGIKRLRELDPHGHITLISTDEHIYSRCILHHYIEGSRDLKHLMFVPHDFIEKNQVHWLKGETVTSIDSQGKKVITHQGSIVPFDKLLIATGSSVFFPPIPGLKEAKNAIGLHDLIDCERIIKSASSAQHIVIMGAGLVGIDATCGLLHTGQSLSIVEMRDRMLPIQLDSRAAKTYEEAFTKKGVKLFFEQGIRKLFLNNQQEITSVELSSGNCIPCDLLIVAAGVRANIHFLEGSDIAVDSLGLLINEQGQTSHPDIYGAGDVTGRHPIWPVAVKEGIVAASNMAGVSKEMTDFFASKSTMNFLGIPTMSLGLAQPEDPENYCIEIEEDERGNYKKIVHREGKIVGALLQGDLAYAGILTQLIRHKIDVSKVKKPLFKIDYSDFFHIDENLEYFYEN